MQAALRTKFASSAHYGAHAPLGYIKAPEQKGHLIPDTKYGWIVTKMFELAVHGNGGGKIRRILEEEKVSTPAWSIEYHLGAENGKRAELLNNPEYLAVLKKYS